MIKVTKELRALQEKGIQRALTKGINAAVEPAIAAGRQGALDHLPASGGLARIIAEARFRVSRLSGAKTAGIVLVASRSKLTGGGKMDLRRMDKGQLRHPVSRSRKVWVMQRIPEGWFSDPLEKLKPQISKDIAAAVQEAVRELAAKTGR